MNSTEIRRGKIFISYRREDSESITGRIHDWLTQRLPREDIFIDVDDVPFGVDFVQQIEATLAQCRVLVVVIGPRWLGHEGTPSTYVRKEVGLALSRKLLLIPVLVEGATMPPAEDLPEPMRPLAYLNAVCVRSGRDFVRDVEDLGTALGIPLTLRESILGPAHGLPAGPSAASAAPLRAETPPPAHRFSRRALLVGSASVVGLAALGGIGVARWFAPIYPYAAGSVLYVYEEDAGYLYAVNGQDGSLRWKYRITAEFTHFSPVAVGTTVCMGTRDGTLFALDGDRGTVRWQQSFPGAAVAAVLAAAGILYVMTGPQREASTGVLPTLYALSADTGSLLWQASNYAAVLVQDDVYGYNSRRVSVNGYIRDEVAGLSALDAQTGQPRWSYPLVTGDDLLAPLSRLVVANHVLYLATGISNLDSSETSILYAITANAGTLLWQAPTSGKSAFLVPEGDTIYISSQLGSPAVAAVSTSDGKLRWRFPITPPIPDELGTPSPLTIADDVVYFTADGVYELDVHTGTMLSHYLPGLGIDAAQPLVAGDMIYVTSPGFAESSFAANSYATVYAVARRSSDRPLVWKKTISSGWADGLTLSDRALYFTAGGEGLYAIARATGAVLWRFQTQTGQGAFTEPLLGPQP